MDDKGDRRDDYEDPEGHGAFPAKVLLFFCTGKGEMPPFPMQNSEQLPSVKELFKK
jgi:hypothetical protein